MKRLFAIASATLLMLASPAAHADEEELIAIAAVCGIALVGTAGVAGGLAAWENGAAADARKAAGRFRSTPTPAAAREVESARAKWQEAHDFNSTDDSYNLIVGTTGLLAGSLCLGVAVGMME